MRGLWVWLGLIAPPPTFEAVSLGPEADVALRVDNLRADLGTLDAWLAEARQEGDVEALQCLEGRHRALSALLGHVEAAAISIAIDGEDDPRVAARVRQAWLADEAAAQLMADAERCTRLDQYGCGGGEITVRVEAPTDVGVIGRAHHPESIERHRW